MTENIYDQNIFQRIGMRHPGGEKSTCRLAELGNQFWEDTLGELEVSKELFNVCCGDGSGMEKFFEKGFSITGLDCSRKLLKEAEEKYPHMHWLLGDAKNLSLVKRKFACVLSECSLSETENLQGRLLQIRKILIPEGLLLSADVLSKAESDQRQWEENFCKAGFELLYKEAHEEWIKEFLAHFLWEATEEEQELLCQKWKKWKRAEYVLSVYRRC